MPENKSSNSMVSMALGFDEKAPKEKADGAVDTNDVLQVSEALRDYVKTKVDNVYTWAKEETGRVQADIDREYAKPYENKPEYDSFTIDDFQIGSVRLSAPPIAVSVEKMRDVQVMPIIRGQAIAGKSSASVVQISLTLDFPNPELLDEELKPLLAEIKTCPFMKLRSYDLAIKLSAAEDFKVSAETTEVQQNILKAEYSKAKIERLVFPLLDDQKRANGDRVAIPQFRNHISLQLQKLLADITDGKANGRSADDLTVELFNMISTAVTQTYAAQLVAVLGGDGYAKLVGTWGYSKSQIQAVLDKSATDFISERQSKFRQARTFFADLLDAVGNQAELNRIAQDASVLLPLNNGFVPVVCQQVILSSIAGKAGAFRVNMIFEYFFHDNYVSKMLYHSFNNSIGWDVTEDPADADFLLRWRDKQYLGIGREVGFEPHTFRNDPNGFVDFLNSRSDDGIPGFLKVMHKAQFSRVCKTFPVDPNEHKLHIFYPQNMPQIQAHALGTNTGARYNAIEIDNADADARGVVCNVQVIWNLNVARHTDEHSAVVRHQWAGGSTLSASFEICIPHDGLPEDISNIDIADPDTNSYAAIIGSMNNMFATMERNRKLLPSDAFIPTTVFVNNPVTALFGATCFELKDIPVFQSDPGRVMTVLNLVEALPVIGAAGHEEHPPEKEHTGGVALTESQAFRLLVASAQKGGRESGYYLRGILEKRATKIYSSVLIRDTGETSLQVVEIRKKRGYFGDIDVPIREERKVLSVSREIDKFTLNAAQVADSLLFSYKIPTDTSLIPYDIPASAYEKAIGSGYEHKVTPRGNEIIKELTDHLLLTVFGYTRANELVRFDPYYIALGNKAKEFDREGVFGRAAALQWAFTGDVEGDVGVDKKVVLDTVLRDAGNTGSEEYLPECMTQAGIKSYNSEASTLDVWLDLIEREEVLDTVLTDQLYPDMVLPRYYEIFDVPPDTQIPNDVLLKWIPSITEAGKLDYANQGDKLPSRSIRDIADPDVYFARERPLLKVAKERGFDTSTKSVAGAVDTIITEAFNATRDDLSGAQSVQASTAQGDNLVTNQMKDSEDNISSNWAELMASIQYNERRMLRAFPTYSMEFFLDIQNTEVNQNYSAPIPGTTSHYEARLFNVLPLIDLEIYEDARDRPNIAQVTFIGRRAGLRNNSWQFLPPKIPQTYRYDSHRERIQFTNNVELVKAHLREQSLLESDPMLLTTKVLASGSRAVIKIGYGTDLNNSRMLPTKIAGTIAEITLGEISQMVVQSFGTQLCNSLNTDIGGSGRYSPNKVLSGAYTVRAFSDIFSALDMRFMGRTGRGVDIDARSLSNEDLERIAVLTYQTRTVLGTAGNKVLGYLGDGINLLGLGLHILEGQKLNAFEKFAVGAVRTLKGWLTPADSDSNFLSDVGEGYLDPLSDFYPEYLNIRGPAVGISDWAISNTNTKNLTAASWIDMICRLNPGTIWWPHTYGDEVRLFWGRPEAIFRADPGVLTPEQSALSLQFIRNRSKKAAVDLFGALRAKIKANRKQILVPYDGLENAVREPDYIVELTNPRDTRGLAEHINFLESQGVSPREVSDLLRKLFIAKAEDISKGEKQISAWEHLLRYGDKELDLSYVRRHLKESGFGSEVTNITTRVDRDFDVLDKHVEGTRARSIDLRYGGTKPSEVISTMVIELGNNLEFLTRYQYEDNFLSALTKLEQLRWEDLTDDAVKDVGINTDALESTGGVLGAFPGTLDYLAGPVKTRGFTALQLKALRFLIERVVEDLNYLYEDPKDVASKRVADDIAGEVEGAIKTGQKSMRALYLNGYRPFRNNHFALSSEKLMSSALEATQAYMTNAVSYDGYTVGYGVLPEERRVSDLDSEMSKLNFGIFEWFKGLIGKTERDRVVDVLFPSQLARGLSKMYRGDLRLIGDPWIKPHDVIYMLDLHNGVYGPVECETVINKLSVQTGLVTIVRPCALTQAHSSRVLTEHIVQQRLLKTYVGIGILAGIGIAAFGGVGVIAGAGVVTAAGVLAGASEIVDSYARLRLSNIPVTDALIKDLSSGESADARTVEDLLNTIMVEAYVPSNGLESRGMARERNQLLQRITTEQDAKVVAQLGVNMIPLKRIATHTPIIAGLRTHSFETIKLPSIPKIIQEGLEPIDLYEQGKRALTDLNILYHDTIDNFWAGMSNITRAATSRAKEVERLKNLFRERGLEIPK